MSLSARNGWLDEEKRVYIIFKIEEIQDILGFSKKKSIDYLNELEQFGLVEKKRRGLGLITITPPVDMSDLKTDTPLAITVEAPVEDKADATPDSNQDEKEKPEKKKSVKKQLAEKKDKAPKQPKPKKVDTKNLGEAI